MSGRIVMIETETTPRPWHVERWSPDVALDQVCGPDGHGVGVTFELTGLFSEADAALIVEAVNTYRPPADPADLARWLQEWAEKQPAITIRRGVEPQVAWRALADELLRRWGR